MKKDAIDLQLHMAVKTLAIFQVETNSKIDELIKKAKLLKEKEEKNKKTDALLEMISVNLNELQDLIKQRNDLSKQIEKLERKELS